MSRTFYTIDDLYLFCKSNNFQKFSSNEHGAPLIVQSIEVFESTDSSKDGLLDVKLKACHIGKNRNGSAISESVMNVHKNSFKGRPILGSIFKADTGEYEFHSHDMQFNEDGEVEYIEQPVGVISQLKDPYLEYDEEEDKTYLMVEGHVFEDYSKAAEILQRHKTCKCSVEIAVEDMSYNADEDYLSIDSFSFRGVTILGYEQDGETEILEGMEGSRITIEDFSEKNNSMFSADCQNKLIETLDKINETLSMFTINNTNQEEVSNEMGHFEELLEKYCIERDVIDFEFENLSDEELDAIFEERFGGSEAGNEEKPAEETFEEGSEEELTDEKQEEEFEDDHEDEPADKFVLQYELSHDDIRSAIYSLLGAESEDAYYYTWIVEVYESKFIYQDCTDGRFYRRNYSVDGDNVALGDESTEVFSEWLSKEEKDALETLKAEYAALKKFRDDYDAATIKAEKDEIFNYEKYSVLDGNEKFKQLKEDSEKFSVDEIKDKCKIIFAEHVMESGEYSATTNHRENKSNKIGFNFKEKPAKKEAYSGLFKD